MHHPDLSTWVDRLWIPSLCIICEFARHLAIGGPVFIAIPHVKNHLISFNTGNNCITHLLCVPYLLFLLAIHMPDHDPILWILLAHTNIQFIIVSHFLFYHLSEFHPISYFFIHTLITIFRSCLIFIWRTLAVLGESDENLYKSHPLFGLYDSLLYLFIYIFFVFLNFLVAP